MAKRGAKRGGGETLFPGRKLENRRGVEGCRGCIGVLSGWEAGTRRADEGAAPLRRLSPFLEEARHAFYQFFLSLSLALEARSPPRVHLVAPAGVPGDTARWRRSTRHWLKAWKSGHPRRAVRPSQGHCPSILLVSIAGLIKFMDDKTVDGVGSRS